MDTTIDLNKANTMPQGIPNEPLPMMQKIGVDQIRKATEILQKYKGGKARLEQKIIANEEFWKLKQWQYMNDGKNDFKPASAWLFSCIQSRYSDAMDSYPTCNFLPRQKDDETEALKLSNIVPIVLDHNEYEDTYSDIVWYTLKHGGSIQAVMWDGSKNNGLGDIAIKKVDLLNFFWEPGITDLQESANIFVTDLVDNDLLIQRYPQCENRLGSNTATVSKYRYDDNVDTTNKSLVIDWYYHTEYNGRKALHYVKYVDDIVLYATENEPEMMERGLYDHTMYPFVSMALYPIEGSIIGYGLTDIGKDTQISIDKINKSIVDNAVVGSKPRFFVRGDGAVNELEYADLSKDFIHINGNVDNDNIRPVETKNLPTIYVNVLQNKVEELKFITSNQDVNNGSTQSGVTAASAIAALQESAGKNARSSNKVFHRAFKEVCYQVVELIRQFYDIPRTFRIIPDTMGTQYVDYSNNGIKPQPMQTAGIQTGFRVPQFDIEVTTEKANPYKKMENNELALSFYNAGFFNPQMADQALACVEMMDFQQKDDVIAKIRENGTLLENMLRFQQLALTLAQKYDPIAAEQIANMINSDGTSAMPEQLGLQAETDLEPNKENTMVAGAREAARQSTQV